jgi:hypothetical protein
VKLLALFWPREEKAHSGEKIDLSKVPLRIGVLLGVSWGNLLADSLRKKSEGEGDAIIGWERRKALLVVSESKVVGGGGMDPP